VNQKFCFDIIIVTIAKNSYIAHFFLQNFINISKIFLYCTFCNHYHANDKIILCIIFFKITALLLFSDCISHFYFKIVLKLYEFTNCNIEKNIQLMNLIQKTDLII